MSEVVNKMCSAKKALQKISQNSHSAETPELMSLSNNVAGLRAVNFIKKGDFSTSIFSATSAKFLGTSFCRTPPDDCFLCLPLNFEKLFRTYFS